MSGINFVVFAIIAWVIYGNPPQVGAPADALVAFYDGHRTRILIAAVVSGLAVLNLLWFAAALRTTLADARQDGWARRRPPPAQPSRLYQLIRQPKPIADRQFEIAFLDPGVAAFCFTFG